MINTISRIMTIATLLFALALSQSVYAQKHSNSKRTPSPSPAF